MSDFRLDVITLKHKYGIELDDIMNPRTMRINMALVPDDCLRPDAPEADDISYEPLELDERSIVARLLE